MPISAPETFQKYLRRAFINNSFEEMSTHKTLRDTWENSFSYLQYTQREMCNFTPYHINLSGKDEYTGNPRKMYFNKAYKPCIDVDRRIINITKDEGVYKKSEFYKKELSAEVLSNNKELFNKLPVILIDSIVVMDYKVVIYDQYLTIILPTNVAFLFKYLRNSENDKRIYTDSDVNILLIPNVYYTEYITHFPKWISIENGMRINITEDIPEEIQNTPGILMCSMYIEDTTIKKQFPRHNVRLDGTIQWDHRLHTEKNDFNYKNATTLMEVSRDAVTNQYYCSPTPDIVEKINNRNPKLAIHINLIFFKDLHVHEYYTSDKLADVCETSSGNEATIACIMKDRDKPWNMAIPIENLLLFKRNNPNSGYKFLYSLDNIQGFYPNFYRIKDPNMEEGNQYKLYYFYKPCYDLHYTCIHDFYFYLLSVKCGNDFLYNLEENIDKLYRHIEDIYPEDSDNFEEFNDTLLHILTYYSYIHRYKDLDMIHNFYNSVNPYKGRSTEYKSERLLEYTKYEPYVLRDYVLEQKKKGAPFFIYANAMDLEGRLRNDTNQEFENMPDKAYTFTEPHYVFSAINNEPFDHPANMRVFVDGLFVMDLYLQRNEFTQYFYIPARLVNNNSVIEIEYVKSFYMEKKLTFTSMDQKETITCAANDPASLPTLADLVIYDDLEVDQPIHRYEYRHFDVSVKNEVGEFATSIGTRKNKLRFVHMDKFTMKPATDVILNKPLKIRLSKSAEGIRYIVPRDGRLFLEFVDNTFGYNKEYLRIFVNGRLLPRELYVFYPMYHYPRIKFLYDLHKDDVLYIDITPYRYRQVYHKQDIFNSGVLEYPDETDTETIETYESDWVLPNPYRVVDYDFCDENQQVSTSEALQPKVVNGYQSTDGTFYTVRGHIYMHYDADGYFIEKIIDDNETKAAIKNNIYEPIQKTVYISHEASDKNYVTKIREKLPLDGIIDLRKIFKKPFDLRYYDMYLNGRRLSACNCYIIDPWTIKLTGVHSTYNLLIFEKERDYEYYGLEYQVKQMYFAVTDLLEKGFITKEERDKIIKFVTDQQEDGHKCNESTLIENEPDEFNPGFFDKYMYFFFDMYYYKYLILKNYINPDIAAISKLVMIDWFEEIYDWYANNPYDNSHADEPNGKLRRERYIDCICLNPDLFIVGLGNPTTGRHHGQRLYALGHLNEVPAEVLRQHIEIAREVTVDKLRKDDLEMDKYLEVRRCLYV